RRRAMGLQPGREAYVGARLERTSAARGGAVLGGTPGGGGEVGIAGAGAGRIGHRVIDERGGQQAVVPRRLARKSSDRAGGLVEHQRANVIARLVVEAERVVPRLAHRLLEVTVE